VSHDPTVGSRDPVEVVRAWWQALQDRDLDALADLLHEHHISTGGPAGRIVGQTAAIAEAGTFIAHGSVDTWHIDDVLLREHNDTAICSYAWSERGRHEGTEFKLAGFATDVLTRDSTGWRISAHHTSIVLGQ
jgi:ketosteroid isomerase-like protein